MENEHLKPCTFLNFLISDNKNTNHNHKHSKVIPDSRKTLGVFKADDQYNTVKGNSAEREVKNGGDSHEHGRSNQDDDTDTTQNHLLTRILEQIEKGHMTHDTIVRWYTDLNDELVRGQITQDEYDNIMNSLSDRLGGSMSSVDGVCCPFG